jgi:hypothetical protein
MMKIEKMIQNEPKLDQQMILCSYLGYHPLLKKILKDRVKEHI